jgi:putative transposase
VSNGSETTDCTWESFLDYLVELHKIVYITNAIESINFQLRKITKNRGHF